jgi:hypothetical protein
MELYRQTHISSTKMPINNTKPLAALAITFLIGSLMLSSTAYVTQAETPTRFTSDDKFANPAQNSTIGFALNGSYASATLQGGTWVFRNLTFDDPKLPYFDLTGLRSIGNFNISARNCNVTVWVYLNVDFTYPVALVSYYSDGAGSQTVNLGLNNTQSTHSSEWSVVTDNNVFLAEGDVWKLLTDNTIVISPQHPGNVTVMHFDFNDPGFQQTLPWWMQHSILLFAGVVLAVTIAAAVLIRVRKNKSSSNDNVWLKYQGWDSRHSFSFA